jgi:hypothetical protein
MPGTDPDEAARVVAGELPELPHLVELPRRGAGADTIGRTAAMLTDLPVEVVPSGWRLARRGGRDLQRANDFLSWDLDAGEQHFAGADWLKIQLAGPWTLAAQVETPRGNRALTDHGAVADLAASLTDGIQAHLAELARRLPGTRFVVQLDEPSLPAVLAGSLPTASGLATVPAVRSPDAEHLLARLLDTLRPHPTIAHCCHPDIPLGLLRSAGFDAVSLDVTRLGQAAAHLDAVGEAIEAGTVLAAGLVPTEDRTAGEGPDRFLKHGRAAASAHAVRCGRGAHRGVPITADSCAEPLLTAWHRAGLEAARFTHVVVTPTCGLGHASPAWARRALELARATARHAVERIAEA